MNRRDFLRWTGIAAIIGVVRPKLPEAEPIETYWDVHPENLPAGASVEFGGMKYHSTAPEYVVGMATRNTEEGETVRLFYPNQSIRIFKAGEGINCGDFVSVGSDGLAYKAREGPPKKRRIKRAFRR
jgi:hypothetical protein